MSTDDLIKLLIACDAGLLSLFLWHMFRCRDVRLDIEKLKRDRAEDER